MGLPIMSVSGIRGVVGETISPEFVARIAYIQTRLSGGGKVVVGRDTRPSGEALARGAFRGIRAAGGIPVDIGIAPTPTTCLCVSEIGASSGIIITASHNPIPYNGYKMVHRSGRLFRGAECEQVYGLFRNGEYPDSASLDKTDISGTESLDAASMHIEKILREVDVALIRSRGMSVAIDSINGAGGAVFPRLLERLGVSWKGVHNKLDGDFVHNPEPRPEHLGDLSALLGSAPDFWGGFVFDPDADRLATMGEHGEPISEEMTLVMALDNLLSRHRSPVATNLSTSMLIDDVAAKYGVAVIRAKIGEANVVEAMDRSGCEYGGEGNGGVIFPRISKCRDGLAGLALILELMARSEKKLNALVSSWPTYSIVKEKISCEGLNPSELIERLAVVFQDEKTDRQDGLKILREDGWVHLRASNTEPIIRCYAEARSEKRARELAGMVLQAATKSA